MTSGDIIYRIPSGDATSETRATRPFPTASRHLPVSQGRTAWIIEKTNAWKNGYKPANVASTSRIRSNRIGSKASKPFEFRMFNR
jgi:hypothetical protein